LQNGEEEERGWFDVLVSCPLLAPPVSDVHKKTRAVRMSGRTSELVSSARPKPTRCSGRFVMMGIGLCSTTG
jgi:hypothetical protein